MRSIFKYVADVNGDVGVAADSKLIHCAVDPKTSAVTFWFEVPNADHTKMMVKRRFNVVATGRDQLPLDTPSVRWNHVTTIVEPNGYVWHVYEKVFIQ